LDCKYCGSSKTRKKGIRNDAQRFKCNDCNKWWRGQVPQIKAKINETKIAKRVVVTPDKHFPLADVDALRVVAKAIEIIKPDAYIDLGDMLEGNKISHHNKLLKKYPLEYIVKKAEEEIEEGLKQLDIIDEALDKINCKEKHITTGNHDEWYNSFYAEYPFLPQFKFENIVSGREYKVHPAGKLLKMGRLHFYHGHHYGGVYHARNHLLKLGCNIMYGHHHSINQDSITHVDGVKSAWSIGCLKDMSDESNLWLKRRKTNWAHGFAIVDFYGGGYFNVQPIVIVNGKTSLWGEVISA